MQEIISKFIEKPNDFFTKAELENNFKEFSNNLHKYLDDIKNISTQWLYGRDLEKANWYCAIFGNETALTEKIISIINVLYNFV